MTARDLNFTAYSHVELFNDDDHEVIESFHEHTKMSAKSGLDVGHRVSKIVADPGILAMMNRAWKVYPAARKYLLNKDAALGDMSLQTALRERRSVGAFGARLLPVPMTMDQLSAMLMHSYGPIRALPWKAKHEDGGFGRPAASAGGLYPIEVYPIVLNVAGLARGLYHYNVPEHALHCVREGDLLPELMECTTYHDLLRDAAVVFVLTGVWKRTLSKYHQRGYRFMLHDAGTLVQNLYLTGTALDLGTCALGGMFDNRTAEMLDTNPLEEPVLLGFVAGGRPEAWTPNGAKGMTPQTQALAERVLSPLTGVIKGLRLLPAQPDGINLYQCVGMAPNYGQLPCSRDISRSGGVGESAEEAVITTLFEGLERYCGALLDRKRMRLGRADSSACLLGERLPLFAPWQYEQAGWPFRPLTADSEVHWASAVSLVDGAPRQVPAGLVYVPYLPTSLQDNLCLSTSTGMAAGNDTDQVLLSGLLETVERDAFMIMWLNRLALPRIELDPACRAARLLSTKLKPIDARLTLVDLTTDIGIPTVMAVLEQRAFGHPVTTLGMAAKADYASAAIKAFFEAASSHGRVCFHLDQNGRQLPLPKADGSDFHSVEDRDIAYTAAGLRERLAFITSSAETRQCGDTPVLQGRTPAERLAHALALVRPHASEVVAVDLATREIAELGVKVQKVLVPELVPLTSDHRFPWLGHRRIFDAPVRMGRRARPARLDELNHDPHPFA